MSAVNAFCRATLCISAAYAVKRQLDGWVSVTFVYCVETAEIWPYRLWNANRKPYPAFKFFDDLSGL